MYSTRRFMTMPVAGAFSYRCWHFFLSFVMLRPWSQSWRRIEFFSHSLNRNTALFLIYIYIWYFLDRVVSLYAFKSFLTGCFFSVHISGGGRREKNSRSGHIKSHLLIRSHYGRLRRRARWRLFFWSVHLLYWCVFSFKHENRPFPRVLLARLRRESRHRFYYRVKRYRLAETQCRFAFIWCAYITTAPTISNVYRKKPLNLMCLSARVFIWYCFDRRSIFPS